MDLCIATYLLLMIICYFYGLIYNEEKEYYDYLYNLM